MIEYYNEDCMDGMKRYEDKHFDLAIVDPPYFEKAAKHDFYGNKISSTGVVRHHRTIQNWNIPEKEYFDELLRVSREQIIWGCNYFEYFLGPGRIVWDKKNEKSSFSKCEIAYCSMHYGVSLFRYRWNGMIQENMHSKEKRIHPTQKPVELYKWLLHKYAKKGDLILDTHVGSASSLIACHLLEFSAVGFEIDEEYYKSSKERLENVMSQGILFNSEVDKHYA